MPRVSLETQVPYLNFYLACNFHKFFRVLIQCIEDRSGNMDRLHHLMWSLATCHSQGSLWTTTMTCEGGPHEQIWRILFCWRQFRLWPFWLIIMDGECLFFTFFAVQLPGIWSSLLTEEGNFFCFFVFVNLFPNWTTAYLRQYSSLIIF
ncbi:hypothetical protein PVAP13_8KG216206 [Panicum virgatum]|uniref:Uncharacterized protein n=1 Tax=Panicum virgatum TaxID=38727 RepID=A0A8T0PRI5_PANVG|nr:hypothetical protein PVAP13_8KG216206 [Panicum virgatum]